MANSDADVRTNDRILSAARAVMAESGVEALSMRAVAVAAGITPGAIYRHFESRDALLEQVADEAFSKLEGGLWKALARFPVGSYERIAELARMYIQFAKENPDDYLLLFGPQGRRRRRYAGSAAADVAEVLRECVVDCIAAGVMAPGDVDAICFFLWGRVHGLILLSLTYDFDAAYPAFAGPEGIDALFEATRAFSLKGLGNR